MGQYLARYYLSCGHVDDVPATMHEIENPIVCAKCLAATEIPQEILDLVLGQGASTCGREKQARHVC